MQKIDEIHSMIKACLAQHEAARTAPRAPIKGLVTDLTAPAAPTDPNEAFKTATETNLSTVAATATAMSTSISDIMTNFDTILTQPGLSTFSATLESVPTVGVLNGTVQYMGVALGSTVGQLSDSWTAFDTLPATPSGTETISLFSYNGDFYAAVGQNVWKKPAKSQGDPSLPTAVDNWANMYAAWQSLGACIPAADSICIAPFSNVTSEGTSSSSALIKLASDGSLSWATNEVVPNMDFQPLQPTTGTAKVFTKIAYWNGAIWACDASNTVYQLQPAVTSGGSLTGYTIGQTIAAGQTIVDMTAVDTGLVVKGDDGWLYRYTINPPSSSQSQDLTATWDKWVQDGGVTNLSAAAPGVVLDLKTLSTYLKAQYITTQTNLFPCVTQIQAFANSNKIYLEDLYQASVEYQAATTADQQQIATKAGQLALNQAKAMGGLLSTTLQQANQMVVLMARQTSQIDGSLATQLSNIDLQITNLTNTLNDLETQEKAITDALYAMIGTTIIGIGLIIAGFIFPAAAPNLWTAGGAMFLGSVVAIGLLSAQLGKVQAAIASTNSDLQGLTTSKTELTAIQGSFTDLTTEYSTLESFWFTMLNTAGQIASDEVLGIALLSDQPSIQAAQAENDTIITAMASYVNTLGAQGIIPPTNPLNISMDFASMSATDLVEHVRSTEPNKKQQASSQLRLVGQLMEAANEKFAAQDVPSYVSMMRQAAILNKSGHNLILL